MSRPRIRSIKPETWKDAELRRCKRDSRLLFAVLMTMADDAGRLNNSAAEIIGHGYPDDEDVTPARLRKWVDELVEHGLVMPYERGGREYIWLPGWRKNQKINRPTPSKLPCPPDPRGSWAPHDGLTESSVNGSRTTHGAFTE